MKLRKIKYKKKKYEVLPLVPNDFIGLDYWPFCYYVLDETKRDVKKFEQPERDWKLKPKNAKNEEEKLEASRDHAIKLGLSVDDEFCKELKKEQLSYNIFLSEIYGASYNLSVEEKYLSPQKTINKTFAESIAIKTKTLKIEPYALMADISKERPALLNPKRYDFNFFILGVGWEMERVTQEKAIKEMNKQQSKVKVRR